MSLRFILFPAILLLSFMSAQSQDYIFNRLTTKDGLLSNNILSVWQDTTGYLWLGTESGLQRYDGNFFRTILQQRTDQIFADRMNRVWIRSGTKLGIFNPQTFSFTSVNYDKNKSAYNSSGVHLNQDASGRVYLIIAGNGCQYFNESKGKFSEENNPFLLPDSLQVIDIIDDNPRGRYWVLSRKGLGYWDKKTRQYYSPYHNSQNDPLLGYKKLPALVSKFFIDRLNRYWVQGWSGSDIRFFCYDASINQFTSDTTGLSNAGNGSYFEVNGFTQYGDSVVAVYGLNCLRINEGQGFHELRDPRINPYGIHFNTVSAVFEDRERLIWIATDNGLYNTKGNLDRNIHVIFSNPGFRGSINSVTEDEQQRLWIGAWSRGVFVMNAKLGTYPQVTPVESLNFPDTFTRLVTSIYNDRISGKVWIGCQEGRLMTYDLKNKTSTLYRPSVFENNIVQQIAADKNGALWFGLNNADLVLCRQTKGRIMDSSFRRVQSFGGSIKKLIPADERLMWIAVNGKGIFLFDTQSEKIVQSFTADNTKAEIVTDVKDILKLTDSLYLIAGNQVGVLNVKTFRVELWPAIDNVEIGNPFALQSDVNGDCWIGSSNGIFKYNPKTKTLTKYSQYDGLITIHNNSYIPQTSLRMSDRRLVFAGNQHLLVFDPADYRSKELPPGVTITGFQLNNRYLPADSLLSLKTIRIPYTRSAFSIEFASISFLNAGKLTYEYKLDGLEDKWTTMKTVVPVKYNFLPPGNYQFLVRAKNDEGLYAAAMTKISLRIVPPFWKTPWFYLLLGIIIISVLFYLHRLRLQRMLHIEKVRSRLARDLHDDMGSTLSTINILSNMALQQKQLDEKTIKNYMGTINSSTGQMMEAMDDIVWSINPNNDNMAKVLARMKETAGAMLEPVKVDYHFEADNAVMYLHFPMESRREIFLIFKEALNNIVKYASCNYVEFTLRKQGAKFILTIKDDGKGFEKSAGGSLVRGNGLKNMKKRAENIQGNISIDSTVGVGTSITLSVPLA